MDWEEKWLKESGERLGTVTAAVTSLKEAIKHIKENCRLCGRCNMTKATCDVAKSYKKIDKACVDLDFFRYHLENSIRRGESV